MAPVRRERTSGEERQILRRWQCSEIRIDWRKLGACGSPAEALMLPGGQGTASWRSLKLSLERQRTVTRSEKWGRTFWVEGTFSCKDLWSDPAWPVQGPGVVTWALFQHLFSLDDNLKDPICEFRLLPNHSVAIPNVHHFLGAGEQISPRFPPQWGLKLLHL